MNLNAPLFWAPKKKIHVSLTRIEFPRQKGPPWEQLFPAFTKIPVAREWRYFCVVSMRCFE